MTPRAEGKKKKDGIIRTQKLGGGAHGAGTQTSEKGVLLSWCWCLCCWSEALLDAAHSNRKKTGSSLSLLVSPAFQFPSVALYGQSLTGKSWRNYCGFQSPNPSVAKLSTEGLCSELGDNNIITGSIGIRSKFKPRSPTSAWLLLFFPDHPHTEMCSLASRGSPVEGLGDMKHC